MVDKEVIIEKIKYQIVNANIVVKIVIANFIIYLLGGVINILGFAFGFTNELMANYYSKFWFYIPSQIQEFIYKPYTLFTYQFLHRGFFHVLSNMAIVYYFGTIFIEHTHKKKVLPLYLLGGFFSGLLYIIIFNIFPSLQGKLIYLVGASGSAMAILAAVATLIPERGTKLFISFRIKYKWIALFFLIINIISIISVSIQNNVEIETSIAGNIAHIGGLAFGYIFIVLYKNGIDLAKPVNVLINNISTFFIRTNEPKISYVNKKFKTKKQFDPYKISKETEEKMNAILDKIKQGGYDKLTKAEKEFLFNNSNK